MTEQLFQNINESNVKIDADKLTDSIYFIRSETAANSITIRVLINKQF